MYKCAMILTGLALSVSSTLRGDDLVPSKPANESTESSATTASNVSEVDIGQSSGAISGGLDIQPLILGPKTVEDVFQSASFQNVQPAPVLAPQFQRNSLSGSLNDRLFGSPALNQSLLSRKRQSLSRQPGTSVVLGSESKGVWRQMQDHCCVSRHRHSVSPPAVEVRSSPILESAEPRMGNF